MSEQLTVDLLVLGGGMAGLTAGAHAARQGQRVLLIEKAPSLGGSALLSNGYLWTVQDLDSFLQEDPGGNPDLARVLVEEFPRAVSWVRSLGVDVSHEIEVLGIGRGHRIDIGTYLKRCETIIDTSGGWVLVSARTTTLRRRDGAVVGARIVDHEGLAVDVDASRTVLATGGLQADQNMLAEHLGRTHASRLLLRSNPHSTGDGLRLAQQVGAASTVGTGGFYGHLVASPIPQFPPGDYLRLAALSSPEGILLNEQGERFTEETRGDHHSTQAALEQSGGRAVLVLDGLARESAATAPLIDGMESIDLFSEADAAGANVASAADISGLAAILSDWGFNGAAAVCTLEATTGRLRRPPYVAIEVRPAITFSYGGIPVNADAAVLSLDGTPIHGLRAAGADIGGLYHRGYTGGLSVAATFGLRASDDVPAMR